ncbi:class I SAM-dependent methyltransferase [Aspergillus affinis]|uniref:class I SAM-dependent methyltransferase n=1 Tax=Aspergillus affinis TaxID=1070780 RepID=UPI0022FF3754|nr:uncharacterized protein KD926_002897 [Aspergillus affinis]KAI9035793.1 hypothetical protein KD926_002897 [Aspergillus affinis]
MSQLDDYVLGRGLVDSVRLDAQHLLWKLHQGFELHPGIPITNHMKIAEIGTGTGVWVFDVAKHVPSSVRLDGYDISDDQFPPRNLWPSNVSLGVMDSLVDPPPSLRGQYDGVHLRMWASNVRESDIGPVIRHAKSLLKPGGYIQWEDADLVNPIVQGEIAEKCDACLQGLFHQVNLDYSWVSDLPRRLRQEGLQVVEFHHGRFNSDATQLCTRTYLMALQEILNGIKRTSSEDINRSVTEQEAVLQQMLGQAKSGMIYNWTPVSVLARVK